MTKGKRARHQAETERNIEVALADVRDCVMASNWTGRGTLRALDQIGEMIGTSRRWMHRLFYRDGPVGMGAERRRLLAFRAADFLDGIATELERKATALRSIAAAKRHREEQPRLPLEQPCAGARDWQKCAA